MAIARDLLVHVISADATVRAACRQGLRDLGHQTSTFADDDAFMDRATDPDCLLLDQGLPGGAHELLRLARDADRRIPVICMAANASAALAVRAMKAGAVDFLCLPAAAADLAQVVSTAVEVARRWREEDSRRSRARALIGRLTPREQAVFGLVLNGMLNKQIAGCLGSSEATVKVHRSRLMRKLEVRSLVELLQLGQELERASHAPSCMVSSLDVPLPLSQRRSPAGADAFALAGGLRKAWRQPA